MLHEKPNTTENRVGNGPDLDEPRKPLDAAAYVRDMRAGGFGVVPMQNGEKHGFALIPGRGFKPLPPEVVDRWHGAFTDPLAEFDVWNFLNEERRTAAAKALIGNDVEKGLTEVRRLKGAALAAYKLEARLERDRHAAYCDKSEEEQDASCLTWPGLSDAGAAADEAGEQHHHAVFYVQKMPINSVADAVAKAQFALENADYSTDEDFKGDALRQIADFLAPQQLLQAAE